MQGLGCACENRQGMGEYTQDELYAMGYDVSGGDSSYYDPPWAGGGSGSGSGSAAGNPAVTNALLNMAGQYTNILGQSISPQTTIRTANGTVIQAPAGQTSNLALSSLFGGGSSAAGGSVSWLPILLIGAVGIFAFKAIK